MSLNERGAFYHLLGDAGGSLAVIVSTAAIAVFDVPVADPIAAILIGMLVLWSAGKVLRESTAILLERSPVSLGKLRSELADIEGVDRVQDLHVWRICSQFSVATVRLVGRPTSLDDRVALRSQIHHRLGEYGVDHSTVELSGKDGRLERPARQG